MPESDLYQDEEVVVLDPYLYHTDEGLASSRENDQRLDEKHDQQHPPQTEDEARYRRSMRTWRHRSLELLYQRENLERFLRSLGYDVEYKTPGRGMPIVKLVKNV